MQRMALGIEYDGANYYGWQRQAHKPSVQAHLEKALSKIAAHPIATFCAGRTDAGVHASGQVIHFETTAVRPVHAWIRGANAYLPPDIRVLWLRQVPEEFDARKSALARRYCYIIANQPVSPGILHRGVTWILPPLEVAAMQAAAQFLRGQHDFSSFRAAGCQAKTPVRTIQAFQIRQSGKYIVLDVIANAFLHHMVRNMAGSLILVGQHKQPVDWIQTVLQARDRRLAGSTAPPNGLYLTQVFYPDNYQIPLSPHVPWFLSAEASFI